MWSFWDHMSVNKRVSL